MDFESPDVEKDFPGLYASENTKKSQSRDSDYSDDDKSSRKDFLGKKERRESKKDKGYVAFAGESSGDEMDETKSPGKSKKSKSTFKFPGKDKKEKEKSKGKDRDTKDKKEEKEKICKKESKEMKKESKDIDKQKVKKKKESKLLKIRDRKKKSIYQQETEKPIFGVPLHIAVERNKSHDGLELPEVVRECIDYIEEHGLACEGIYKISGLKSKLQKLKNQYNQGEKVYLYEHEPHIVASLLKQFLRDLPEPILTHELTPKFEEAAALKNEQKRAETLEKLLNELPNCNRLLLSWIFVHMLHVVKLEKRNKMNLQNIFIVLSPTLQISHNVLQAIFAHSDVLFQGVEIKKLVPMELDISRLRDSPISIAVEICKKENMLNTLHAELNAGFRDEKKEEQLWEIQRVVTQLKRKLRFLRQVQDASNPRSNEADIKRKDSDGTDEFAVNTVIQQQASVAKLSETVPANELHKEVPSKVKDSIINETSLLPVSPQINNSSNADQVSEAQNIPSPHLEDMSHGIAVKSINANSKENLSTELSSVPNDTVTITENAVNVTEDSATEFCEKNAEISEKVEVPVPSPDLEDVQSSENEDMCTLLKEEKMLMLQYDELMLLGEELRRKLNSEKLEIGRLQMEINEYQHLYKFKRYSFDSTENSSSDSEESSASECAEEEDLCTVLQDLMKENQILQVKNKELSKVIQRERDICLNTKVQMKMLQT